MSASELAAVIVAICSVAAVVLLAVALVALTRTLKALREVANHTVSRHLNGVVERQV